MFERKVFLKEFLWHLGKAAVAVLLALLIFQTFKNKIVTIISTLNKQKTAAYVLNNRSNTIVNLQHDFATMEPNLKNIENAKPLADNVVDFKAALDGIAANHSLTQTVEFGLPSDDQKTISYTITLNSNVDSLIPYLKDFEKLPFLSTVNNISFQNKNNGSWDGDCVITIKATVFTKPVID